MGEIVVSTELENTVDWDIASEGLRDESTVRRTTVDGVADTGAVMPQDVVDRLGLRTRREVLVAYANEHRETRQVAGPVTVQIGNRFMNADCIVGPPSSEPLIGQIVLEALDLAADCGNRTLAPRPESPDGPLLKLKWTMPQRLCALGLDASSTGSNGAGCDVLRVRSSRRGRRAVIRADRPVAMP